MATWPSGSKASTTNLDAGADKPSLARADLKTNVDNVNAIIDMFNIGSPTNNQVLRYNSSTNVFDVVTLTTGSTTISGLTDVNITSPTTNQVLSYSSAQSKWINTTASSGIAGVYADANPSLGGNLTVMGYSIVSASNGDIIIAPNGTGKTKINAINYNEGAIYDLGTTGGTIAPNVTNGNVQKITLNSALTINGFTSPVAGQSVTIIIYGGTSYTSITSTMKFAGGIKTLTGTAGCIDILTIYYDGTNYFASLGKGFA
jgi:hypothetical protein